MFIKKINQIFTINTNHITKNQIIFWLSLSITFAIIYSLMLWQQIFSVEYIIQDDARQHVVWMQRFVDSQLFPNDLIADYFQSVSPIGYSTVYKLMASIGINPLLFSKILPMILSLITTVYCFLFTLKIFPIPFTAFLASVMLNQSLWMKNDIASGTSRGFIYLLLLAFFYYFFDKKLIPCIIVLICQSLFYPPTVLISAGLIFFDLIFNYLKTKKLDKFYIITLIVSILILLPYQLQSSTFAPTVSLEEARNLATFYPEGRMSFFYDDNPIYFWLGASGPGMIANLSWMPIPNYLAILLPLFLYFKNKFTLIKEGKFQIFGKIILVSLGLFFLAHILIFTLYLPNRYTIHTFRIIIDISAAIVVSILINTSFNDFKRFKNNWQKKVLPLTISLILITPTILYPYLLETFPKGNYVQGNHSKTYEFFAQQPKDIMIASLADEADNIPSFSARSVLVSREYAVPFHNGYYLNKLLPKIIDTIAVQYTTDISQLQEYIQKYNINFWLIHKNAFNYEYLANNKWLQEFQPVTQNAENILKNNKIPTLKTFIKSCKVLEDKELIVINAKCIK